MNSIRNKLSKSKIARYFGSAVVLAAPLAILVACGTDDAEPVPPEAQVIPIEHTALTRVNVTGDSAHLTFTVPRELIFANEQNELSPEGTKQVADVYGRTLLKASPQPGEINTNFMPLDLLAAYLRGDAFWQGGKAYFVDEAGNNVDVFARYNDTFGFTENNCKTINYRGSWPAQGIEVAYVARQGVNVPAAELLQPVRPNVSALKTFVDLTDSLHANTDSEAKIRSALVFSPQSTQSSVLWARQIGASDLPTLWKDAVASFTFSSASTGATSTTLPTALAYNPSERELDIHLVPKPNYVLSTSTFSLKPYVNLAAIPTLVDAQPAFQDFKNTNQIANYSVRVKNGVIEAFGGAALPPNTVLKYATSLNSNEWVDAYTFSQDFLQISTEIASPLPVYLKLFGTTTDTTQYEVRESVVALAKQPASLAYVDATSLVSDLLRQSVNLNTSTANQITWVNAVTNLASYGSSFASTSYYYGNLATIKEAYESGVWTPSLPARPILNAPNINDSHLYVRINPVDNVLISPIIIDMTTSSQINDLVLRLRATDATAMATQLDAIQANLTSTHANTTWNNVVTTIPTELRNVILGVEYLSGNYLSFLEAQNAPGWSSSLPTRLDEDKSKRNLWARLVTTPGAQLTIATYRNLTSTSNVQKVRTLVDALIDDQLYSPTKNVISQTNGELTYQSSNVLPIGTKLEWQVFGNSSWIDESELHNALIQVSTVDELRLTRTRLAVTDQTSYAITNTREGVVKVEGIIGIVDMSGYYAQVAALRVDEARSTDQVVIWHNANTALLFPGALLYALDKVEYTIGDFGGKTPTIAKSEWSASVPTSFAGGLVEREFWIHVILKNGYIAKLGNYAVVDETGLKNVPLAAALSTAKLDALLDQVSVASGSTNLSVTWTNADFEIPTELKSVISKVQYHEGPLVGTDFSNVTGWQDDLPTTTAFYPDTSTRGLWARYVRVPGAPAITREYYAMTSASGILQVPGVIDTQDWYKNYDISKAALIGNYDNLVALEGDLPADADRVGTLLIQYKLNKDAKSTELSPLRTLSQLRDYFFENSRILFGQIDLSTFTVQIGAVAVPGKPYVVLDNKKRALDTSGFFENSYFNTSDYFEAAFVASNIRVSGYSHNATFSLINDNLPRQISAVEYFVNDVAGPPPALATWSKSLPLPLPFLFDHRYLWVQVKTKLGIVIGGSSPMRDITQVSRVRSLKSYAPSLDWYEKFTLSDLSLEGTRENPSIANIDEKNAFLARYGLNVQFITLAFDSGPIPNSYRQTSTQFLNSIRNGNLDVNRDKFRVAITPLEVYKQSIEIPPDDDKDIILKVNLLPSGA